jgi:hypothetical protein
MIRRALLLLAMAGIYAAITRRRQTRARLVEDRAAEAQWANEGGASAPATL